MTKITALGGEPIRDADLIDTDSLIEQVENLSEDKLRSESVDELTDKIVQSAILDPPRVNTDEADRTKVSDPPNAKIRVEMPASGDIELLAHPLVSLSSRDEPFEVEFDDGTLAYELEVGESTAPEIESEIEWREHALSFHPEKNREKIQKKNDDARRRVRRTIRKRKDKIKSEEEKLDELLDTDDR